MKKVLISLDDAKDIINKWYHSPGDMEFHFNKWFDAQPDAPIYRSGQFKIPAEVVEKFLQFDNLVLDGSRCETCGQLGRIKEGVLSKMKTTGGENDN